MKRTLSIAAAALAAGTIGGALLVPPAQSQAQVQQGAQVGRFVRLGITPSSPAWRASNSADTSIIWSMDSATGAILGCGDATGNCTVVAGSAPRR
jgi:hypothetical protein